MDMSGRITVGFVQVAAILALAACSNGADLGNLRPEANAGIDQSVKAGSAVGLDGSGSRDSDGAIESFLWEQVGEGESVQLTGADKSKASFTAPRKEGVLIFRLSVTDDDGATASDQIRIRVRPAQSTATSGMDNRPMNRGCIAPERPTGGNAEIELQRAFSPLSFDKPLALLQAPGGHGRWYVVEQDGLVHTFVGGQGSATRFADISDRVKGPGYPGSEQGLLGMAFPPDFATSRKVYLSYTGQPNGASVISRFATSEDGATLDPSSEEVILTVPQPGSNHNGGNIAFGPDDGYLYIGLGDGGGAGDPDNNAQNTHNLLGAMLRIDVSKSAGGKPYAIPPDNPFASSSGCGDENGCPEIWAWGLRNPWRWSFDRETGELWAADVGQDEREEVNVVEKGGNYGWRCYEGNYPYNTEGCPGPDQYIAPRAEHSHEDSSNKSITGGYVYRGAAIPALRGTYIYGDFVSSIVRGLSVEPGSTPQELLPASYKYAISSFGEGNDGELYLVDYKKGELYKMVPKGGPTASGSFPQKLSRTGCFDADDPTRPVDALIPYGVNAPLWSDGAEKYRWFAIPDSTAIRIDSDGNNWIFPPGSVLAKEFRIGGKRVETRLLIRHDDGEWAGYSYEWNDQGTDATLLNGAKSKTIAGQEWAYPSPAQCMFCHTQAAGFVLGPETVQLNGLFTYSASGETANQMKTHEAIGLFAEPLPDQLPAVVNYMDPGEPLGARARAYLYANCSSCHRPGATGLVDLRHDTPLGEMEICDRPPEHGDAGAGSDARLLAPGSPSKSVILARMKSTGAERMPPIGTGIVDPVGIEVITSWIESLSGCPNPS